MPCGLHTVPCSRMSGCAVLFFGLCAFTQCLPAQVRALDEPAPRSLFVLLRRLAAMCAGRPRWACLASLGAPSVDRHCTGVYDLVIEPTVGSKRSEWRRMALGGLP